MVNIQTHKDHHLSYDAIIRNHEHYCNMEFIKENNIYKSILKLVLLFQTLQLIAQRPIASIMKNPKIFTNKIHEEWKPMATCAHNPAHVSKPKRKTQATNEKATRDSYKGTKPLRMD